MANGVKWYGREFYKSLDQGLIKNVTAAGKIVETELKKLLSAPGRSVSTVTTKTGKTRKKYGKKGEFVSKPGEPPRKQTGALLRSVKRKLYRKRGKVRISTKGSALEVGDANLEARPHTSKAIENTRDEVAKALTTFVTTSTGH